jgi:hypothetical protein
VVGMQKRTQQTTLLRTKDLRAHGVLGPRPMHRRIAIDAVGAILLIGLWSLVRDVCGPGPGESP